MRIAAVWVFVIVATGAWAVVPGALLGQQPADAPDIVTGTIDSIDQAELKMTVQPDVGRATSFTVRNPDLMKGLHQGDRVSVQLDEQHIAIKVTRMAPPELRKPPGGQ